MEHNINPGGRVAQAAVPSVRERFVTVDGRQMALLEAGAGPISVVFDSGLGDSSATWDAVQSQVSRFAHTVSYDRAGRGQSHFVAGSRTSLDIANDLHAMLETARIPGPYILVGHSFGGYNVRVFADQFPDSVAGLILVDASHERQAQAFGTVLGNVALPPRAFGQSEALAFARQEQATFADPSYPANFVDPEGIDWAITSEQVSRTRVPDHVALTVITAGIGGWWWFEDLTGIVAEISAQLSVTWRNLQDELVHLSPRGQQVIAEKSHHYVHHDQPEVVVEAIRRMLDSVRGT
jgi:pimeloyl-ACP methyl ester carboxylesterase